VHGKTWGKKGQTPVVERPGQRQSISAASAVNSRGGFWYCTYQGGLNAEAFISLLRRMMRRRSKPVHLVLDGLPAHKTTLVKTYVASTKGMLTLHYLPGYAPELNPDELVWSHMKRTGVARAPLRRGEKLQAKIEAPILIPRPLSANSHAHIPRSVPTERPRALRRATVPAGKGLPEVGTPVYAADCTTSWDCPTITQWCHRIMRRHDPRRRRSLD
jgi:transposase